MSSIDYARKRYSTKSFDSTKKIPQILADDMKELLRLSPSSVNSQPWHFIVAETPDGKARIAKSTVGMYDYNKTKVLNASHVVVFCAKNDLDARHLQALTNQEWADGRFRDEQTKKDQHERRAMYANLHKNEVKDMELWLIKQTYLNVGNFLLGVAGLGLDAVAMEGFDSAILDKEFGLSEKGLKSLVIVAVGYRAADDVNAKLPKSRLLLKETLTEV